MPPLQALAAEIRRRLGPAPEGDEWPLVSIVVLNRDGAEHLRRLLAGLAERTDYPRLELILVDNGSSDDSLQLARSFEAPFPISILANPHNESFSDANNQGAELAAGELLLFLNNDVEPFEPGWLRELVACHRRSGAGAVSSTLIYPEGQGAGAGEGASAGEGTGGYRVQTGPIRLRASRDAVAIEPAGEDREPLDDELGVDAESVAVFGACLLVGRKPFARVGGFTHGYFYGGEDEDLCLKLRAEGTRTIYSGRSLLVHHVSSTSRELHGAAGGPSRRANGLLLQARWGPRVWRECQLNRLAGAKLWSAPEPAPAVDAPSAEEVLRLGFCVLADGLWEELDSPVERLAAELKHRGHRHLVLRDDAINDPRGLFYDVSVHVRGRRRYIPTPGRLNVLWMPSGNGAASGAECRRYDLAVTADRQLAAQLRRDSDTTPVLTLERSEPAASLVDAVLEHTDQVGLRTRVEPREALHDGCID